MTQALFDMEHTMIKYALYSWASVLAFAACGGNDAQTEQATATESGMTIPEVVPNTAHEPAVELEMAAGTIPAGAERYLCQVFGNPFGKDVDLVTMESTSTYSHHHFLFTGEDFTEPGDSYPCQEIPPAMPFAFTAQGNHIVNNYPAGMGLRVRSSDGFMLQGHYVNITDKPISPVVTVRLFAGKPDAVDVHVGVAFMMMGPGQDGVSPIPPRTPPTSPVRFPGQSCPITGFQGEPAHALWMVGHMHASGVRIEGRLDDRVVYESEQWDDPPTKILDPALPISGSQSMWWTCEYKNETNSQIMFGDKYNDAMCALFVGYYPADPDSPTQLCQRPAGFDAVGMGAGF